MSGPIDGQPRLTIPAAIVPADGRFGSGPSKVRVAAAQEVARRGGELLGTSHRRAGVRDVVGRLRSGLTELFGLDADAEVVLGNGGSTTFWDAASFGLIEQRSQHLCFGEFSEKFSAVTASAPHLAEPDVIVAAPGTHPVSRPPGGGDALVGAPADAPINVPVDASINALADVPVDAIALTHNETSTGVCAPVQRPDWTLGADGPTASSDGRVLTLVDATSAAGAMAWDTSQADCYYFSPQKAFASDGGLWIALCSPAAVERIERLGSSVGGSGSGGNSGNGPGSGQGESRWTPKSLDLSVALANSRLNQTYNTPALATILLTVNTLEWMLDGGGLEWSAARSAANSGTIYNWATEREWCDPFVADPQMRSPVVCTIDFHDVSADDIAAVLRANGIVDTEGYRKLGRNQLRIAAFPAIELADTEALCACIDYVVEQLAN